VSDSLTDFNQIWNSSQIFSKRRQYKNVHDIFPVGTTLINADRQRDLTKPIGSFADFANAPKDH